MRMLDDRPEIWPYILASLAIHVLVFLFIPKAVTTPLFKEDPIEVFAVEDTPKIEKSWRIADIAEPKVQQKPKSTKFLGMYDSAVPEEMVGVGNRPGKAGSAPRKRQASKVARPVERDKPVKGSGKLYAFSKEIFDEKRPAVEEEQEPAPASEQASGALDDFYPDFRRGARTYLNVLRYPGVEYFVRMKRAFKVTFNPGPSLQDYFLRNRVARGSIDVVLGVSVRRSGELSELFVFRSSGVPSYDEEALRTVRASSPFSTPPEKFLEDDGVLRMSWTFSVYL